MPSLIQKSPRHSKASLHQLAFPKGKFKRLLGHYNLGVLKTAQRIGRGFVNENWKVETTRGRFFLKRRHPDLRQPKIIRAQHALITYLKPKCFPVPQILPTTSGNTLLVLDGDFYEIQTFIDGVPYQTERAAHFRNAAAILGFYHMCVEGFSSPALGEQGTLYCPEKLNENLNKVVTRWEEERNSMTLDTLKRLKANAVNLAHRFSKHPQLPELVIHGDYHAGNLIFKDDKIAAVVDYDKASWQPRVAELAEALIFFSANSPGLFTHIVYPGFISWEKFTEFLRCYASAFKTSNRANYTSNQQNLPGLKPSADQASQIKPLAFDELRVLPDYISCIWLTVSLRLLLEKGPFNDDTPEALHELLVLSEWAAKNTPRMIETSLMALNIQPKYHQC